MSDLQEHVQETIDRAVSSGAERGIQVAAYRGGEPLLQAPFLKEFLPALRARGQKIYLETNGICPKELAEVIDLVDIVWVLRLYRNPVERIAQSVQLLPNKKWNQQVLRIVHVMSSFKDSRHRQVFG